MTDALPIKVRRPRPEDYSLIFSAWKVSYRDSPLMYWLDDDAYYRRMDRITTPLVYRGNVLVAANPTDLDHILGWVCWQDEAVHYAWVRPEFRRLLIATRLLACTGHATDKPLPCTHWTDVCEDVPVLFRPSMIRRGRHERARGRHERAHRGEADKAVAGNEAVRVG